MVTFEFEPCKTTLMLKCWVWNRPALLLIIMFIHSKLLVFLVCKIPRLETRGIWGRKGKKDPQQGSPRDTHTDNEGRDDKKRLLDFGRERSTARIGGQQLHLHESPQEEWITKRRREGTGKTNKAQKDGRAKVQRNSKAREARDKRAGTGWSCAYDRGSCHVTGRGNQSAPASWGQI